MQKIICDTCNYSLSDLEKFRDKEGFIDLDRAEVSLTDASRERRGNQARLKNWVNFKGQKALVKGEILLEDKVNYGYYAELIVEEVGKKLNIPMAHYDLIKITDKDKNVIRGVLSEIMYDEKDNLLSLHDLISEATLEKSAFVDATDYHFMMDDLKKSLAAKDYNSKEIENVLRDLKKRMAFSILMLETDKHIENYSFIESAEKIVLSPNYDSEAALLLDNDLETIEKLLLDYNTLKEVADISQPRIGFMKPFNEGGLESFWMDTLEELIVDDDVYDYCVETLAPEIDMDVIFESVEKRIKAAIPEEVKLLSKYAYKCRLFDFKRILDGTIL